MHAKTIKFVFYLSNNKNKAIILIINPYIIFKEVILWRIQINLRYIHSSIIL